MSRIWKRRIAAICAVIFFLIAGCVSASAIVYARFPRPYRAAVVASGLDETLVYALIKAESGFDETAVSRVGATGLMQLMPATAQFICKKEGMEWDLSRLTDGAYNIKVGCAYLSYLLQRFEKEETALAAYNAGEGTVRDWLRDEALSPDGKTLTRIPYRETEDYVKKIKKYKKIYAFFYHKT